MRFYSAKTQTEYQEVYSLLQFPRGYYPNFYGWYWGKVVKGIENGERKIIVAFDEKIKTIVGVAIIKNAEEKKICTLFVNKEHRHKGIGTKLMQKAIDCLNDKTPLFTFPQELAKDFEKLMTKFGFRFTKAYDGYYKEGKVEYSFNGFLEEDAKIQELLVLYTKAA